MRGDADEAAAGLSILDWDSSHYARTVARIDGEPSDRMLGQLLERAEQQKVELVYWRAPKGRDVPRSLLERFVGARIAGHLRLGRELEAEPRLERPAGDFELTVYQGPEDDPELLALAVAAGRYSRFRADTRLDAERCDAMYERWIRRSVAGEMADEVLVATQAARPCALLTFGVAGALAEIGLVATAEAQRGRGLAGAMMAFAHRRMLRLGAARAEVVTQTENAPARRVYSRAGYRVVVEGDFYHFHMRT